ncbi:MAG: (Fe-S)-binding protein [Elusimicrobiota bacterium]
MENNNSFSLKAIEEKTAACNRCGFCTSYCPTYRATGNETHSPRGRNQLVRALIEGKLSNPLDAQSSIDSCLLCGECTTVCFSEVPTADLMVQARQFLASKKGRSKIEKFLLRTIIPYPPRLSKLIWFLFFGKKIGISWLLSKMGLLKLISPTLEAAHQVSGPVSLSFLMDYALAKKHLEQEFSVEKVALIPVCGTQYLNSQIGISTVKLLEKLQISFAIPSLPCCGLPSASYGDLSQVKLSAKNNIEMISKYENILVDDSSCLSHFKDYSKYLQDDSLALKKAQQLMLKLRDMPSYFLQKGLKDLLRKKTWKGGLVLYHDPCKAQHAMKSTQAPRELLDSIQNLHRVEITDADQCCGGGGTYSFVHPEMSQAILEVKIKSIIDSGCSVVVTSSASCLNQLQFGLKKKESRIEALHLNQFLIKVLGEI